MNDDRFDHDEALSDAELARTVEDALRSLGIASSGSREAALRSAVAELGRKTTPLLVAPKLAVDRHWEILDQRPAPDGENDPR
jgi:hypothetical protein